MLPVETGATAKKGKRERVSVCCVIVSEYGGSAEVLESGKILSSCTDAPPFFSSFLSAAAYKSRQQRPPVTAPASPATLDDNDNDDDDRYTYTRRSRRASALVLMCTISCANDRFVQNARHGRERVRYAPQAHVFMLPLNIFSTIFLSLARASTATASSPRVYNNVVPLCI